MEDDKKTEEKKLRDLTPEKDAKGGNIGGPPMPPTHQPPTHQPPIDPDLGAKPRIAQV